MLRVGKSKATMVHLTRPSTLGGVTVVDVLAAADDTAHLDAVRRWSRSAWLAWREHHDIVRKWADLA